MAVLGILELFFFSGDWRPCRSIDEEKFFPVLHFFMDDRPYMLPENIDKFVSIRYNCSIFVLLAENENKTSAENDPKGVENDCCY